MALIEQLKQLGVPVQPNSDGVIDTSVLVYDVDQLKDLLDLGDAPDVRQEHHEALLAGIDPGGDLDDGLVRRVHAHVFGSAEISDEDRALAQAVFPLRVSVLAAPGPWVVNSPQDLSTSDGSLKRVDVTDLTLEQGGSFTVRATPLLFTCTTFTRTGNTGSSLADFNILGRTGTTPNQPAQPGAATQAGTGKVGECSSGGIAGPGGGPGTPGAPGTPGTAGDPGAPGTPSQQATIVISQKLTADQITIFTQSGIGGQGAHGGQGGNGQQGGNGGNGVDCGCTGNAGGPGADGGVGGKGGKAGDGGNGVDAAGNIVVRVPFQADTTKIVGTAIPAPPGAPGGRGDGGNGGTGGTGGSAGKHNDGGGGGGTAGQGPTGDPGAYGTHTGVPAQITPKVN